MLNVHNVTSLRLHHSCEATPIAPAKWPLIRSKSMFIFTLSSGLSREGGLSNGVHSIVYSICREPYLAKSGGENAKQTISCSG